MLLHLRTFSLQEKTGKEQGGEKKKYTAGAGGMLHANALDFSTHRSVFNYCRLMNRNAPSRR